MRENTTQRRPQAIHLIYVTENVTAVQLKRRSLLLNLNISRTSCTTKGCSYINLLNIILNNLRSNGFAILSVYH